MVSKMSDYAYGVFHGFVVAMVLEFAFVMLII